MQRFSTTNYNYGRPGFDGVKLKLRVANAYYRGKSIDVFEKILTGSPLLSSRRFSLVRYFTARSLFSLVHTDREPGTG